MGYYDVMQVCLNGHKITDSYNRNPEFRKKFCDICGEKTITSCPKCDAPIRGKHHLEGAVVLGFQTPVPVHCPYCGASYP